ncbi:hypothetical protein [Thermocatellispora tengchongensis]|uniref:hypothetical protein n=1 Tax=Thermocatellispora tengchongensis TaxID=1073253 RepID=UPI0036289664
MCNPRRVKVRASKRLSQAWQAELERTVALSATVTGEARIIEPVGAGLAPPVRARLAEILADDPDWEKTEDGLRRDVPGGHLLYHPDTGELEIVATVAAEVSAEGQARRVIGGVAEAEAQVEVTVGYYEDGYRGRTKRVAEREGREQAEGEAEKQAVREAAERAGSEREAAERRLREQEGRCWPRRGPTPSRRSRARGPPARTR